MHKLPITMSGGGDRLRAFQHKVYALKDCVNSYCETSCFFAENEAVTHVVEQAEIRHEDITASDISEIVPVQVLDAENSLINEFAEMEQNYRVLSTRYPHDTSLTEGWLTLLSAKSEFCVFVGLYDQAEQAVKALLDQPSLDMHLEMKAHMIMIFRAIQLYDLPVLEKHLDLGVRVAKQSGSKKCEVMFSRYYGLLLFLRGEYETAKNALLKSIVELENAFEPCVERTVHVSYTYRYLGELASFQADYSSAFLYLEKALDHLGPNGMHVRRATYYIYYAQAKLFSGDYQCARILLNQFISILAH